MRTTTSRNFSGPDISPFERQNAKILRSPLKLFGVVEPETGDPPFALLCERRDTDTLFGEEPTMADTAPSALSAHAGTWYFLITFLPSPALIRR
jgi:hypothetical protein